MNNSRKEMTLIEWISLHCLGMYDYREYAREMFCLPSARTMKQALKVLNKLEAQFDAYLAQEIAKNCK